MTRKQAEAVDLATDPDFRFFTEIGIIAQLTERMLAATLPDGVHPSHFGIVNHLVRTGDGKTPIRIAEAMQVTKTTMTHSLRVLEERGFIRVGPNPEDARGKIVQLTKKGRDFREDAVARVAERFGGMFTPEIRAAMARSLDDVVTIRRFLDANRAT